MLTSPGLAVNSNKEPNATKSCHLGIQVGICWVPRNVWDNSRALWQQLSHVSLLPCGSSFAVTHSAAGGSLTLLDLFPKVGVMPTSLIDKAIGPSTPCSRHFPDPSGPDMHCCQHYSPMCLLLTAIPTLTISNVCAYSHHLPTITLRQMLGLGPYLCDPRIHPRARPPQKSGLMNGRGGTTYTAPRKQPLKEISPLSRNSDQELAGWGWGIWPVLTPVSPSLTSAWPGTAQPTPPSILLSTEVLWEGEEELEL
jgi:hypothetical protein